MSAANAVEVRCGVDLASVAAVHWSIDRFGDRYLQRIFTDYEVATCRGTRPVAAGRLAARFAAKEATIKVLRPGSEGVDWRSIEVRQSATGAADVVLSGSAAQLARDVRMHTISVSLTHEGDMAGAVVVAVCEEEETEGA